MSEVRGSSPAAAGNPQAGEPDVKSGMVMRGWNRVSKHGSLRLVLAVVTGALMLTPAVAMAATTYPGGGPRPSQFSAGSEGWTDTNHSCTLLFGLLPNAACTITNGVDATTGN